MLVFSSNFSGLKVILRVKAGDFIVYTMRIIFEIILILVTTFHLPQTIASQGIEPHGIPYDTIYLKEETKLIYSKTDEFRIIRMVNPTIDTVIFSISMKEPISAVGWLKADFNNYFVFYHGQNEYKWMQIYDKRTGKIIAIGDVMEFDTIKNIICYADWDRPILNVFTFTYSKFEKYITPSVPCLHWWYCIQIIGITDKDLTIKYTGKDNIKYKKTYLR